MANQLKQHIEMSIDVQGDTGTPSQIVLDFEENDLPLTREAIIRARICNQNGYTDASNATIAPTAGKGQTLETHSAAKDLTLRSQPNVAAAETLTISGVVIDGETATAGRVYEFDGDGNVGVGNVAVDISASMTASQGTLTIAEPLTIGDTIQIGTKTYVFVANGTGNTDGEIDLGADEAASKVNIVAAVMGTDGYNVANADVTMAAFSGDDAVITAVVPGAVGDTIVTAEIGQGMTHASNVFDAATLGTTTAGVDCSAANAVTALVAAITGDSSAVVTAVDGAGDTVDVTAVTTGVAGNSIASTDTMANGAWGAATLSGGVAALASRIGITLTDASAETVALRIGPPVLNGFAIDFSQNTLEVAHAAP